MTTLTRQLLAPGLLHITLNRPDKRNALSAQLIEDLIEAVDSAEQSGTDTVVFSGNGKNFSSGFDFDGYEAQSDGDLLLRFVRIETLLQKISASRIYTIGLAHGRNFGAGADLFAACKARIATPESTFLFPGIRFGLVLGTNRLGQLLGHDQARAALEHGATLTARDALRLNLATAVVEPPEWDAYILQAHQQSQSIQRPYRDLLYDTLHASGLQHTDMSLLTRSAAAPGLKERIAAYLAR